MIFRVLAEIDDHAFNKALLDNWIDQLGLLKQTTFMLLYNDLTHVRHYTPSNLSAWRMIVSAEEAQELLNKLKGKRESELDKNAKKVLEEALKLIQKELDKQSDGNDGSD